MRRIQCLCSSVLLLAACGGSPQPPADDDTTGGVDAAPGPDAVDLPDAHTAPAFAVQYLDPDHGPFSGGTKTTIRGNGFVPGMEILFDGRRVDPLDIELIDSRRVTVYTPAGEPGPADVELQAGDKTATLPGGYGYEAIQVSPGKGSVAGGTYVIIDGYATSWNDSTIVTVDGRPMVNVAVANEQQLTGLTPPGLAGTADVKVITSGDVQVGNDAFEYFATGDPFLGGMAGGFIDGTVNVVVVNAFTGDGVDGAYVILGDPLTSPYQGTCDTLGQITFSAPGLLGPITVTASKDGWETSSFVVYDARDITIFLVPPSTPSTGPFPPGRDVGHVYGYVYFGDATGIGSPLWDLVPEPRTPTEVKRVYVTATTRSIYGSGFGPSLPIDYSFDPSVSAWPFDLTVFPGAMAIVATAGLYDPLRDTSGVGVTGFEPFAMGVARGVLVGPGENVFGVDVIVNIPLDSAIRVELVDPPALDTPPWPGPTHYELTAFVDLGGEGVIPMPKGDVPATPDPEPQPNMYVFPPGETAVTLSNMAPLTENIADASYSFLAGAYSAGGGNPFSVRVVTGVTDIELPQLIDGFLGMPRPTDPFPGSVGTGQSIHFRPEGPSMGEATFNIDILSSSDGTPLYRIFTRGDIMDVQLPPMPPTPAFTDVAWFFYRVTIPGLTFDQFNYGHLNQTFWSAYAADAYYVQFPPATNP